MQLAPNPSQHRLSGFGGTDLLAGSKLVRLTYLDEGGISKREPSVVVAGVIVHGDLQLARVEEHLIGLRDKHIPESDRANFVFHSTDIWSGGKYFKDRNVWPLERRLKILEDLADIPAAFSLPIAYGVSNKAHVQQMVGEATDKLLDLVYHACAFASATQLVERFLRGYYPDEYTLVIAEDRDAVRRMIKRVQAALQGRTDDLPKELLAEFAELPYQHIRDTVHFAAKTEAHLLQVADICAFLIRGFVSGHPQSGPLFGRLMPVLLAPVLPKLGILPP